MMDQVFFMDHEQEPPSQTELFDLMVRAAHKLPDMKGAKLAIRLNETARRYPPEIIRMLMEGEL